MLQCNPVLMLDGVMAAESSDFSRQIEGLSLQSGGKNIKDFVQFAKLLSTAVMPTMKRDDQAHPGFNPPRRVGDVLGTAVSSALAVHRQTGGLLDGIAIPSALCVRL